MKESTSRLLAYGKEFFIAGEHELEQSTNLAHMQAVLKFHDAVEFCVRAVIEEHNVNHDRHLDLLPLMRCINQSISAKKLPLVSQMDFLNTTRGKVKHHASVPSPEDVQRCRLNAREFLEQVSKDYLNVDFLSVSRLLLIEDKVVRQYFEEAERKKREGDYLEALILIKKAFYAARPSDYTFISKEPFFSGFFLTSGFSDMSSGLRDLSALRDPIEKIVDKINELEDSIALIMMGVDVLKLRRFEEITPHFVFTANSGCNIYWNDARTPTEELVQEAMGYVIDMTLVWQRKGVVGNHPELSERFRRLGEPWRQVRRETWHYAREDPSANETGAENTTA